MVEAGDDGVFGDAFDVGNGGTRAQGGSRDLEADFDSIVVPVARGIVALSKDLTILGVAHGWDMKAVGRGEIELVAEQGDIAGGRFHLNASVWGESPGDTGDRGCESRLDGFDDRGKHGSRVMVRGVVACGLDDGNGAIADGTVDVLDVHKVSDDGVGVASAGDVEFVVAGEAARRWRTCESVAPGVWNLGERPGVDGETDGSPKFEHERRVYGGSERRSPTPDIRSRTTRSGIMASRHMAAFLGMVSGVVGVLLAPQATETSRGIGQPERQAEPDPAYVLNFTMERIDGTEESLEKYKGKVIVMVNVASKCGFTTQYKGLERLYRTYKDDGLVVLGFPANNFANQEPGTNEEIAAFCRDTYDVTFPMFAKISVIGEDQHPLYKRLTSQPAPIGGNPKWNFTKFVVDQKGRVVARVDPDRVYVRTNELEPDLEKKIRELLGKGEAPTPGGRTKAEG